MSLIKQAFAVVACAGIALSADARANDMRYANVKPSQMLEDKRMNTKLFLLHQAELSQGRFVFERARVDNAIGIVCETRSVVEIKMSSNGQVTDMKIEGHEADCKDNALVPESWGEMRGKDMTNLPGSLIHGINQIPKRADVIYEWSQRHDQSNGILSTTVREWNLAKGEVCLETSEAIRTGIVTYHTVDSYKWGCFDMKGSAKAHAKKLEDHLKIQPL